MLVLQKRLDVAMNEIQDLRHHVEDLKGQLFGRAELLERRLNVIMEQQEDAGRPTGKTSGKKQTGSGWVRQPEALADNQILSPLTTQPLPWEDAEDAICASPTSPTVTVMKIPGHFPFAELGHDSEAWTTPWLTEELVVWVLAIMLKDERASLVAMLVGALVLCCTGIIDSTGLCANLSFILTIDSCLTGVLWHICRRFKALYEAAQRYDLHQSNKDPKSGLGPIVDETEVEDVPIVLA